MSRLVVRVTLVIALGVIVGLSSVYIGYWALLCGVVGVFILPIVAEALSDLIPVNRRTDKRSSERRGRLSSE